MLRHDEVSVCPASFAGPAEIPVAQPATVCAPASSKTVWFAPFVNDGASFTGVTVIVNVCAADGVHAAVGGAAAVLQPHRHRRRAIAFAAGVNVNVPADDTAG